VVAGVGSGRNAADAEGLNGVGGVWAGAVFVDGPHAVTPKPLREGSNSRWRAPSSQRAREARAAVGPQGLTHHAWWNDRCSGWKESLDFLQTVLRQQVGPVGPCAVHSGLRARTLVLIGALAQRTTTRCRLQSFVLAAPLCSLRERGQPPSPGSLTRRRWWLQGPFFGVLGFSQGATVGGLLCTNRMQQVLEFKPKVREEGRPCVTPVYCCRSPRYHSTSLPCVSFLGMWTTSAQGPL
jgi:hypothetical protein